MSDYTGGHAFPAMHFDLRDDEHGMTLRDWFAGQAASGICSSRDEAGVMLEHGYEWIATEAYRVADAMLKERNK
jgi:hypothetical protein